MLKTQFLDLSLSLVISPSSMTLPPHVYHTFPAHPSTWISNRYHTISIFKMKYGFSFHKLVPPTIYPRSVSGNFIFPLLGQKLCTPTSVLSFAPLYCSSSSADRTSPESVQQDPHWFPYSLFSKSSQNGSHQNKKWIMSFLCNRSPSVFSLEPKQNPCKRPRHSAPILLCSIFPSLLLLFPWFIPLQPHWSSSLPWIGIPPIPHLPSSHPTLVPFHLLIHLVWVLSCGSLLAFFVSLHKCSLFHEA